MSRQHSVVRLVCTVLVGSVGILSRRCSRGLVGSVGILSRRCRRRLVGSVGILGKCRRYKVVRGPNCTCSSHRSPTSRHLSCNNCLAPREGDWAQYVPLGRRQTQCSLGSVGRASCPHTVVLLEIRGGERQQPQQQRSTIGALSTKTFP
jgi:hypothetical protein